MKFKLLKNQLTSALRAIESGKTVTLIEKNGSLGGATISNGSILFQQVLNFQKNYFEICYPFKIRQKTLIIVFCNPLDEESEDFFCLWGKQFDERIQLNACKVEISCKLT